MRYSIVIVSATLSLTGCVSTGILPAGPNTYTVTESVDPMLGGSVAAQKRSLTAANAFCLEKGREFLPLEMFAPRSASPYGPTDYSVTFRCLPAGDPELARGGRNRAPDAIIEQRQR